MSPATRRLVLATLPLALATIGFAAHAADPKLKIYTGTSPAPKTVNLDTVSFIPGNLAGQRQLVATTRAGNFLCNATQTSANLLKLTLDGKSYAVQTAGLPTNTSPIEYALQSGDFSLRLSGVTGIGDCLSSHTFGPSGNNLQLQFADQLSLPVGEAVYYDIDSRAFDIRVTKPVLCESYDSTGLTIRLVDSNRPLFNAQQAQTLRGFDPINYRYPPGSALLETVAKTANSQRLVQCTVPGSLRTETAPAGSDPDGPADPIVIFADGFEPEAAAPGAKADIVISIVENGSFSGNNLQQRGAMPGLSLTYTVRVMNQGGAAASGFRLREYATGDQAISLDSSHPPVRVLDGGQGSSSCQRIDIDDNVIGTCNVSFPITLNQTTLPAGEGFRFQLTRTIGDGDTEPNQRAFIGYAAFVNPTVQTEANFSNNYAWLQVDTIANQPPVIPVINDESMDEDDENAPLLVDFTVTDYENDSFTVTASSTSNPAGVFPATIPVTLVSPNNYRLSLTPAADQNGTARITVSATDGNSSPTTRSFDVIVNPVNDAPSFEFNSLIGNENGTPIIVSELGVDNCSADYCEMMSENFLTNLSPGPSNESDQTVTPVTQPAGGLHYLPDGSCVAAPAEVGGVAPDTFFATGPGNKRLPYIVPKGDSYTLRAILGRVVGAVDCTFQVQDDGPDTAPNINISAPRVLRIRYEVPNAPPTLELLVDDGAAATDEDTQLTILLNALDPEQAPLSFTVTSNNSALFSGDFYSITPAPPEATDHTHELTLAPQPNANSEADGGDATITVRVSDGKKFAEESVSVGVNSINDAPTFAFAATLADDNGVPAVIAQLGEESCTTAYCEASADNFLVSLSPGAANEAGQNVQPLTQTASGLNYLPDGSCFAAPQEDGGVEPADFFMTGPGGKKLPYIAHDDGVYTLHAPLTRIQGAVDCSIRVKDDGLGTPPHVNVSQPQTLRIRYVVPAPANSAPNIEPVGSQTISELSIGAHALPESLTVIPLTITDPDGDNLTVSVESRTEDQSLIPDNALEVVHITGDEYELRLRPEPHKNGTALITVTASDGDLTDSESFTLTVNAVNDPPVITMDDPLIVTAGSDSCPADIEESCAGSFPISVAPGPVGADDEVNQVVGLDLDGCAEPETNGVAPASFFVDGELPTVNDGDDGEFNLTFQLQRVPGDVECTVTANDDGIGPETTSKTFLIRYQESP